MGAKRNGSRKHDAGIDRLTVIVYRTADGAWCAQGCEIDYQAEGTSPKDVQRAFEAGLAATIHANLQRFESLRATFKPAPIAVVARALANGVCRHYAQVTRHTFPFALEYLETETAA